MRHHSSARTRLDNLSCCLRQEVLVDERIEIAVEHALGISDLEARTLVLDLLIRMQNVVADRLPAEADVLDIASLLRQLRLTFLLGELGEPRLEDTHRRLLVRRLRALVLALGDDAGWQMRDPHGGICLVDVLTTCALGAVGVDRSEEHTSELQSRPHLVCRLLLEKKKKKRKKNKSNKKKKKKKSSQKTI